MRVISGTARGTHLITIEGQATRPTLDRVKEALFNILQKEIYNSKVLDLFAGSGALGIECLSRGATKAVFCDNTSKAITAIRQNLEKTHFMEKAQMIAKDYKKCLSIVKAEGQIFDLIFLDPPYRLNLIGDCVNRILDLQILSKEGKIVIETDDEKRELENLKQIPINIDEVRKYGRVRLIFLSLKGV